MDSTANCVNRPVLHYYIYNVQDSTKKSVLI
jgi:hypothetical protein